jgi:hypothetical protein
VDERSFFFFFFFPSNEKKKKEEKRKESQCKGVFISPQKMNKKVNEGKR